MISPDDPSLEARRKGVENELLDSIKPPKMAGPGSQPDAIRKAYRANLISLQLEGLPVDDNTPSMLFWEYIVAMQEKYRKSLSSHNQESN